MMIPLEPPPEVMAEWLRSIKPGELRMVYLEESQYDSFSSSRTRLNAAYKDSGNDLWLKLWTNTSQNRALVRGMTVAEHEAMDADPTLKEKYEKEHPKGFFDIEEHWEVGTWHEIPQ